MVVVNQKEKNEEDDLQSFARIGRNVGFFAFFCLAMLVGGANRLLSTSPRQAAVLDGVSPLVEDDVRNDTSHKSISTPLNPTPNHENSQETNKVEKSQENSKIGKSEKTKKIRDAPTLYFTVGLEGTGHHFIQTLGTSSPYLKLGEETGAAEYARDTLHELTAHMMYNCDNHLYKDFEMPNTKKLGHDQMKPRIRGGSRRLGKRTKAYVQKVVHSYTSKFHTVEALENDLGQHLKEFAKLANEDPDVPPYIAVNAQGHDKWDEISYPNNLYCARHGYPDIDVFATKLQEANLNYGFLYLYRDLYSVIKSTTINRKFNHNIRTAIALYSDMLDAIEGQFTRNPNGNLACVGLFDESQPQEQRWDRLGKLLGYHDPQVFRDIVHQKMMPGKVMSQAEKDKLIPEELRPQMEALVAKDKRVLDLCKEQLVPFEDL